MIYAKSLSTVKLIGLACALSCNINSDPEPDTSGPSNGTRPVLNATVVCDVSRVDDSVIRILFVGNSLTYSNNLPQLVEGVGSMNGKSISSETLAFPNYALEDHWNEKKMQRLICEGNFDFVVIQQGPSSQADGREMLFDFGQRIKNLCDSRGTELAFFLVWPAKTNYHTFDGVIKNYTDAANATISLLCPVGAEFKRHGDSGSYWFYSADNFHPSQEGSESAAKIIYSTLVK